MIVVQRFRAVQRSPTVPISVISRFTNPSPPQTHRHTNTTHAHRREHTMMLSQPSVASRPWAAASRQHTVAPVGRRPVTALTRRHVRVQATQQEQDKDAAAAAQQQAQQQQPPEDMPVWVRREKEREMQAASGKKELPWPLYLVCSALVAIAAVGSVFEYFDGNAVFGVIPPDSPLWAPVLALFAFTGLPTAGFLFFKGVNAANEAAERQDRMDGYIK